MKKYTTPLIVAKGSSVELTKFVPNTLWGDGSMEPTDGLGVAGSLGFSL